MNKVLYHNHNSRPFELKGMIECLNHYVEKFNKRPDTMVMSLNSELIESEIPVKVVERATNVYPYQLQIGHSEDNTIGISKHDLEEPFRYTLDGTERVSKAIKTPKGKSTPKRRGKPVYCTINGMGSMMFIDKHHAATYFGITVSSININISDQSKSGGLLKLDGKKVKLDWHYV